MKLNFKVTLTEEAVEELKESYNYFSNHPENRTDAYTDDWIEGYEGGIKDALSSIGINTDFLTE